MDMFGSFAAGLGQLLSLNVLIGLAVGTLVGFVFGIIPGLQSVTALVVVLPFTFGLDPVVAMYIFAGIIGSAGRGGSIMAIAVGIPGTAQNAATVLDGYPSRSAAKPAARWASRHRPRCSAPPSAW